MQQLHWLRTSQRKTLGTPWVGEEAFTAFDADGSGTIDFEELGSLFESQAP